MQGKATLCDYRRQGMGMLLKNIDDTDVQDLNIKLHCLDHQKAQNIIDRHDQASRRVPDGMQ
ncbi:MAG: hypothetical protein OSB69_12190 [Alphaproteobacteria bacterium]|nr:hypothetical protein [Alphaproteobacteria bacterium]